MHLLLHYLLAMLRCEVLITIIYDVCEEVIIP